MEQALYIGIMSGTSLDGADAVLVDFAAPKHPHILTHAYAPMPQHLREELLALNQRTENELHRSAVAANQLIAHVYTPVVEKLLHQAQLEPGQIIAIGAHGQTVRHQPHLRDNTAYTLQLNAPALLAELTGITVIADFRSRDIAAGGQGAPLACAFHAKQFAQSDKTIAVLNLGGIANLTILTPNDQILGFDSGPANALMDEWTEKHTGLPFDENGMWASSGAVIPKLLQTLLEETYFSRPAPKSTGRDLFHIKWLNHHLHTLPEGDQFLPQDVQATLLELTAQTTIQALKRYAEHTNELLLCGGGALNQVLAQRIAELAYPIKVHSTEHYGLPPLQVEAAAFAWLAKQCVTLQPANAPQVTGAKGPRILGAIYPT